MADIINNGGSVTFGGRLIKSIKELPSEAELSVGDSKREAEAKANILAEMDRLRLELEKLKGETEEIKNTKPRKAVDNSTAATA